MTKLLCTAILFAGMAGLVSTSTMSSAVAVQKDKKDTKAAKPGTIEINEGKDEKYRFVIRDSEGKLLAMSGPTGFEKREDAVKAIETLKEVLPKAVVAAEKKTTK